MLGDYALWLVSTAQGMGFLQAGEVISFGEIKAWSDLSGVSVTGWEAEALRSLSSTYLSGLREFEKQEAKPPYLTELGEARYASDYTARRKAALRSR